MTTPELKRLYKSSTNKMIAGVCPGLAYYFGMDPTLMRVLWAVVGLFTGVIPFVVLYIVLAIVMPAENSASTNPANVIRENVCNLSDDAEQAGQRFSDAVSGQRTASAEATTPQPAAPSDNWQTIAGVILVAIGAIFLLMNFGMFSWLSWGRFWPIILIVVGLGIVMSRVRTKQRLRAAYCLSSQLTHLRTWCSTCIRAMRRSSILLPNSMFITSLAISSNEANKGVKALLA